MKIEIKKKYNHYTIESELSKKIPFQEPYTKKKGTITRKTILTQFPIKITKNTSLYDVSNLIKESVLAIYWNMKGITTNLVPIFDIESKDTILKTYQTLLTKTGIFFGIDTDNIIYSERNTHFIKNLFVELVNNGLIYEDYSINYRSINEQKTLGNDEIERKTVKAKQYNIRYFVDTKNISLIVPTTQPETIFADVALAVHPDDKRYKKIINSKVIIPIINKTIPIIADESIDPMEGTGIIRITPAHDKKSLLIAKKHGFKIDKFAIDKNGCFTTCAGEHFCGKKAEEFTKNIIKNLDDIHNLESTKTIEIDMPFHRKTGERAWPLLCNQLFIKIDKEIYTIYEMFENETIQIIPHNKHEDIKNMIKTIEHLPVTKEDSKGVCLPLRKSKNGKSYFISDNEFLNVPVKKNKNKKTVLSLIIYHLVVDKKLQQHFNIEECIDVLLSKNSTGEKTILETYVELFDEILPRGYRKEIQELKKIIEYTKKTSQTTYNEKFSLGLINILDKSLAIINQKKGGYALHIDILVNDEGLTLQTKKIEETIGYGMLFMRIMEACNNNKKEPQKICYLTEENILEFIKILTIHQCIQKKIFFHSCIIKHTISPTKIHKELYKEVTKKYGIDCTRMYAINPINDITEYHHFINKIRNASIFIVKHLQEKKSIKKIPNLQQIAMQIEKKANELNEFESWIIYKTIELQKEYNEMMNQGIIEEVLQKLIITIKKDFCDKYLEISKIYETEHSNKIMLRCMGTFLKLLHPFSPFLTQYIREIFGREKSIFQQYIEDKIPNITKNYKTQLFMDIIDTLLTMKQKYNYAKHEQVDIGFFAPLDFFRYLKQQEKILTKIINTGTISYLENEKHLEGYYTETIINITIGIQKQFKETIKKKENLQEILHQKEQELQTIKLLVANLSANKTNPEIIKQKKQEIIKLKKEIEELQYYIQKNKLHK